jgi:RNA-binding protein 39
MFDPSQYVVLLVGLIFFRETEPNWDQEIGQDVKEECIKFGTVHHIHVEKDSPGFVYLRFGSIPSAQNAINALNGRWFSGRMIEADFMSEITYKARFPEAFS